MDCRAVMVLSRLSFTAASASPTRWIPIPEVTSISTVTGTASIPIHFAACMFISILYVFLIRPSSMAATPKMASDTEKHDKKKEKCDEILMLK